jgi:hypothetical protein
MTQQEFNQQHPTGEQLTMIHYDFKTTERTAQPANVLGTRSVSDDPEEFVIDVMFTALNEKWQLTPIMFGITSNIDNL